MNRELWNEHWTHLPRFECPKCNLGRLKHEGSPLIQEPTYSYVEQSDNDWEPEWSILRFTMMLKCDEKPCGEIATVAGDVTIVVYDDYETIEQHYVNCFKPKFFRPSPHVFTISNKLNDECKNQLVKAFELMWVDAGAATNRIRIFIEKLMDQYQVPTTKISAKSKMYDLKLADRINELEKSKPGHKEAFDALRWVGNEGSHSGKSTRETLLTCFEVLEDLLADLVDGKKDRLNNWKQLTISNKGK